MSHSVRVVVMGVSAAGKSTIARALAAELGAAFVDADDLHPPANVAKMASGTALDDDDRRPWLDAVARRLADGDVVVACSALKTVYRDRLRSGAPGTVFVHLTGSAGLLARRAAAREDHFMPATLLASQLAVLEPLTGDEDGITLDVDAAPAEIATAAADWVRSRSG